MTDLRARLSIYPWMERKNAMKQDNELERRLELATSGDYEGEKFSGGLIAALIVVGLVLPLIILVAGWFML